MPCDAMLCYAMPCDAMLCQAATYCAAGALDAFDPDYARCAAFRSASCLEGAEAEHSIS